MASADNRAKWISALVRQILFQKAGTRMDGRAHSSEDTARCRLELSQQPSAGIRTLVAKLDAIEGSQLLRACREHLQSVRPPHGVDGEQKGFLWFRLGCSENSSPRNSPWRTATNVCPTIASHRRADVVPTRIGWDVRASRLKDRMCYEHSNKCTSHQPHCPSCAQIMRLARITPRSDDLPDLYTFECRACGVSHVEAALL